MYCFWRYAPTWIILMFFYFVSAIDSTRNTVEDYSSAADCLLSNCRSDYSSDHNSSNGRPQSIASDTCCSCSDSSCICMLKLGIITVVMTRGEIELTCRKWKSKAIITFIGHWNMYLTYDWLLPLAISFLNSFGICWEFLIIVAVM